MKIRHPLVLKVVGFVAACLTRLWIGLVRVRYRPIGPCLIPHYRGFLGGRFLYAFWHENLLVNAGSYGRSDVHVLVSKHADGELISQACRWLGFSLVRGSSTRDYVEAVRSMMRLARTQHLVVTPDGPRGPRRCVQPGLVYLASRTGLPIVPVSVAYRRAWRTPTWDRFAMPFPWSDVVVVTTAPIHVPPDARKEQLELHRQRVEEAMRQADEAAERMLGRCGSPKKTAAARRAA
ncbi:MAG TPA: lysophospholipid acyltransferase family protein [Gemmataceae bacterium]|nr:lysophospholipid acyltransferase family protein [Gemmataceae bacterium]